MTELFLSEREIRDEAERLSRDVMGCCASEALFHVRRGAMEGTLFASKLVRLYALLGESEGEERR